MELLFFALYIALLVFLVYWFQRMLKKETGLTELNWKLTCISYLAAFGLPSVVVGILSLLIKVLVFLFV